MTKLAIALLPDLTAACLDLEPDTDRSAAAIIDRVDTVVYGRGEMSGGGDVPDRLLEVALVAVDRESCQEIWYRGTIVPAHICAGGDGVPGVSQRVSWYLDFILEQVPAAARRSPAAVTVASII